MWHHDKARAIIQAYVDAVTDGSGVILDDATLDKPYGWVFFYQSRAYVETGDFMEMLAGNAPVIFNRVSGEYHVTGTAHPVEDYISEYEATLPRHQLALPVQVRARLRRQDGR